MIVRLNQWLTVPEKTALALPRKVSIHLNWLMDGQKLDGSRAARADGMRI